MTTLRLALFAAAVLAALVATAPPAGACSCLGQSFETRYREADAAMIATVLAADDERVTLRVDHEFKTDLPAEIVLENGEESTCGLGLETVGNEVGLFLHRDDDGWAASLCDYVDPDELPGARERLPEPLGEGTAALIAFGAFSGGRLAALDAEGRPLAYGEGRGAAGQVSVCPGSRRAVELAYDSAGTWIAVRRLRDMAIMAERRAPFGRGAVDVSCRDPEAQQVVVAYDRSYRSRRKDLVARIVGGRPRVLWRGSARRIELDGDFAFADENLSRGMRAIDTRTGAQRRLRGVRSYTEDWQVSPDGTRAAAISTGMDRDRTGAGEAALVIVRLTGRPGVRVGELSLHWLDASILWLDDRRLIFGGDSNFLRLYDDRLNLLRRYDTEFTPIKLVVQSGRVYGLGRGLEVAEGPDMAERALGDLPADGLWYLAPIPGGTDIDTGG